MNYHTKPFKGNKNGVVPTNAPTSVPTSIPPDQEMYYHNGSVLLSNVHIYNVYIGQFSSNTTNLMKYFASKLGSSKWIQILNSYYEYSNGKSSFIQANSITYKDTWYLNYNINQELTDYVVTNLLTNALINNGITACDNCIFMIMFNGKYKYSGWNDGSEGSSFCGYHSTMGYQPPGSTPNMQIKFGVVGDGTSAVPANVNCIPYGGVPTANGDFAGDNLVSTYAHEMAEIVTDYDGTAWHGNDKSISEIADPCSFDFGTSGSSNIQVGSRNFLVQALWQNNHGCVWEYIGKSSSRQIFPSHAPVAQPTVSPALSGLEEFDLTYHGPGGVMANGRGDGVVLYNVFLGDLSPSTTSLMTFFSQQIGSSSWYDVLSSYYLLDDTYGILYVADTASFGGNYNDLTSSRGLQLNQSYIENLLLNIVNANPNTTALDVYTVMFRGDFNVSIDGQWWLKDWCSYHGSFLAQPGDQVVKYALVGDPSTAPGQTGSVCEPVSGRPTANGDLGADSMAVGYAQQLAQTVTNYQHFSWYSDSNGLEAGSACFGQFGPNFVPPINNSNIQLGGKPFLVPSIWQHGEGCTLTKI